MTRPFYPEERTLQNLSRRCGEEKNHFPCREPNRGRPVRSQSTELSRHLPWRLINLNFKSKFCIAWLRKVYALCDGFGTKKGDINEEFMILHKKKLRDSCKLSRVVRTVKCRTSKQTDQTCSRERREEKRTELCYKSSWETSSEKTRLNYYEW
jgi:hypothetical protein